MPNQVIQEDSIFFNKENLSDDSNYCENRQVVEYIVNSGIINSGSVNNEDSNANNRK